MAADSDPAQDMKFLLARWAKGFLPYDQSVLS
jgi:hypothetical protein